MDKEILNKLNNKLGFMDNDGVILRYPKFRLDGATWNKYATNHTRVNTGNYFYIIGVSRKPTDKQLEEVKKSIADFEALLNPAITKNKKVVNEAKTSDEKFNLPNSENEVINNE